MKLSLDDGSTVAVEVGDENTYDQAQYVRRGGENKVYMSDGTLKGALEKDYFALRDKAIVNHEDKDVQSFSASGNGFAWAVDRDGDGWKLTAPTRETADKSTVDGVLSRIRTTRAKAFPAEELAPADAKKYGFDPPAVQAVFLLGADKVRKTLQLGEVGEGKTKKAYAHLQEGGPVAEIEPGLIKDVQKPLSDLKDRTVAAFDKEKAKKLEVIPATGEKFVVDRSKEKAAGATFETDKFAIEGRDDKVKTWKMTSAFYTLSTLKGVAIADEHATDLSKYGLDKPEWTYVVRGDDDKELSRILIGKLSDTRYLVMKAGTERVVFVEKTVIDGLPKQPEDLLDAAPVKAPPVAAPVTASSGK